MCNYGGTTVNDVDDKNDANGIVSNVDKKSTQMSGHLFFSLFLFLDSLKFEAEAKFLGSAF